MMLACHLGEGFLMFCDCITGRDDWYGANDIPRQHPVFQTLFIHLINLNLIARICRLLREQFCTGPVICRMNKLDFSNNA